MKQVFLTMAFVVLAMFSAMAQNNTNGELAQVVVSGKAEQEVVPDVIYMRVTLNQSDNKGKYTLVQLEKRFRDVLEQMKVNIPSSVFMENAGSTYGKVRWISGNEPLTTKTYIVKLSTADEVSTLISKLATVDISNVSVDKYEYSKQAELENELRVKAMKDAQSKAMTLAGAVGQSIGKAFYIQDTNFYRSGDNYVRLAATYKGDMAEPNVMSDVQFEKIKYTVQVQVKFVLN